MRFAPSSAAVRHPSVLPLLGVSLLPALLVLAIACFSLSREEQWIRLPGSSLPRPPIVRQPPKISIRLTRQGMVTVGGESAPEGALAAAWQRERAALRMLGFEPSQATVVVRADPDLSTDKVQRVLETAQAAGFTQCVLRPVEASPLPNDSPRPKP